MTNTNQSIQIGRIVKDAELKKTEKGLSYCEFTIASNLSFLKNQKYEEFTNYFSYCIFDKYAENIFKYLKKGTLVCVKSQLKQNRWIQDGKTLTKIEFFNTSVELLAKAYKEKPAYSINNSPDPLIVEEKTDNEIEKNYQYEEPKLDEFDFGEDQISTYFTN